MIGLTIVAVLWCLMWYGLGKYHGYQDGFKAGKEDAYADVAASEGQ